MATKKVTRSKGSKKPAAKAPAAVLRAAKAQIAGALKEGHRIPRPGTVDPVLEAAVRSSAEARDKIDQLPVSMTFRQLCSLLGENIEPDRFAATVLDSIADQIETIAVIIDNAPDFSEDSWRLFKNLAERTKYAGAVVSWLESEKPGELLEVQP